jgi:hypothetical protein
LVKRIRILQIVKNTTRNTACIDRDFFKLVKKKNKTLTCCYFTCSSTRVSNKSRKLANQIAIGKQPPAAGKQQGKKDEGGQKLVARGEGKKKGGGRERSRKTYIATKTTTTTKKKKKKRRRSGAKATYTRTKLSKRTPNGKRTKRWRELPTFF